MKQKAGESAACKEKRATERVSEAIRVHGGPRWACLHCNSIYINFSVSKMEAARLTRATEEQRIPTKSNLT